MVQVDQSDKSTHSRLGWDSVEVDRESRFFFLPETKVKASIPTTTTTAMQIESFYQDPTERSIVWPLSGIAAVT